MLWATLLPLLVLLIPPPAEGLLQLEKEYSHIKSISSLDPMGGIYSIEGGVLYLHPVSGTIVSYSNAMLGPVTAVDASDPLNILVFHGDFGNVVFLDRNFTVKSRIEPSALPDLPARVCYATQDGFWAWYPSLFQLVRHNKRGQEMVQSPDLRNSLPQMLPVRFLAESNGRLFAAANGIWVFDLFAGFLFHIPHIQTDEFQVIGNKVFYLHREQLHVYDFFLQQENVILLPEKGVKSFIVADNAIYLQTGNALKKFYFTGNFY